MQGGPLFTSIESTKTVGTYRFIFNEKDAVEVDKSQLGIDAKLESIGSWDESNVNYRYITDDEVTFTGIHPKSQGSDFWQNHYKNMCSTIPTEIKTNLLHKPPQHKINMPFVLSYSDATRAESVTECNLTMDEDSTSTNVTINQTSQQGGQSVAVSRLISIFSTFKHRLAEIDLERGTFNLKQRNMDDSISSVIQYVSRLATCVLGVRTDMNALSDRIIAQIQKLTTMVKALSNQDLPRKQQRPPPQASPEGLILQDIPVQSNSPASSTVRSKAHRISSWADKLDVDGDEMENAEYGPDNNETTPLPRGSY
jgi:hypothetical protein